MTQPKGVLNYVILKPRQNIVLNLFEAEKYEPAIIVQQLVGTLIYYSNFGRYEPRIAERWERINDKTWRFSLIENLKCENGEIISAETFKKSLETSLFLFEKRGGIPILSSLKGYKKFIHENKSISDIRHITPIEGIEAKDQVLTFVFDHSVNSGLLQILSFSPFGFICAENYKSNGDWADDRQFISSGPYKVESIEIGRQYVIKKNPQWKGFLNGSPDKIVFSHDASNFQPDEALIIDAFTNEYKNENLIPYSLVPEYLNSVLLGNFKDGYFGSKANRKRFKKIFNKNVLSILPKKFGINARATTFYPNQQNPTEVSAKISDEKLGALTLPSKPLKIEGSIPKEGTARWYAWQVLKETLQELSLPYKFNNNESTFAEIVNSDYDIRIRGSSIGGGVEAWGLYVSFCSSMGIKFPDPENKVCNLIKEFENGSINEEELTHRFFFHIEDDAAILPVSHYGVNLFVSENLDATTFSPLLSIMKFDQIKIGK